MKVSPSNLRTRFLFKLNAKQSGSDLTDQKSRIESYPRSQKNFLQNKRFLHVRRKGRIIPARFNTKNKMHWEVNMVFLKNHNRWLNSSNKLFIFNWEVKIHWKNTESPLNWSESESDWWGRYGAWCGAALESSALRWNWLWVALRFWLRSSKAPRLTAFTLKPTKIPKNLLSRFIW